jgi:hypothetical protein
MSFDGESLLSDAERRLVIRSEVVIVAVILGENRVTGNCISAGRGRPYEEPGSRVDSTPQGPVTRGHVARWVADGAGPHQCEDRSSSGIVAAIHP